MTTSRPRDTRRIERLAASCEPAIFADAKFFERFPYRRFRIRLASAAEVAFHSEFHGLHVPPGKRLFVVVRQIEKGVRVRAFTFGDECNTEGVDEVGEDEARWLFFRLAEAGGDQLGEPGGGLH